MARNIGSNRDIAARGRFIDRLEFSHETPTPAFARRASSHIGSHELGVLAHNIEFRGTDEFTTQQYQLQQDNQQPVSILKRGKHHKDERKIDKKTGIQFTEDNRYAYGLNFLREPSPIESMIKFY